LFFETEKRSLRECNFYTFHRQNAGLNRVVFWLHWLQFEGGDHGRNGRFFGKPLPMKSSLLLPALFLFALAATSCGSSGDGPKAGAGESAGTPAREAKPGSPDSGENASRDSAELFRKLQFQSSGNCEDKSRKYSFAAPMDIVVERTIHSVKIALLPNGTFEIYYYARWPMSNNSGYFFSDENLVHSGQVWSISGTKLSLASAGVITAEPETGLMIMEFDRFHDSAPMHKKFWSGRKMPISAVVAKQSPFFNVPKNCEER
jgi:hypothetical protein